MITKKLFKSLLGCSLFLFNTSIHGSENKKNTVGELAYAIMFDSLISIPKVNELIELCSNKTGEFNYNLPTYKAGLGLLSAVEFQLPLQKLSEIIISPNKSQIYKSSCQFYSSNLPFINRMEFMNKSEGNTSFTAHYGIKGKFYTSFTYDMHAEWLRSNGWIMERGYTLPGIKKTRGIEGYISDIHSFTLVTAIDKNRSLRISANWDDIGATLPIVGQIHATYQDISEGIQKGDSNIRDYFKLKDKNCYIDSSDSKVSINK